MLHVKHPNTSFVWAIFILAFSGWNIGVGYFLERRERNTAEKWPESTTSHIRLHKLLSWLDYTSLGLELCYWCQKLDAQHHIQLVLCVWHFAIHEQDSYNCFFGDRNRQWGWLLLHLSLHSSITHYTHIQLLFFFAKWTSHCNDSNSFARLRCVRKRDQRHSKAEQGEVDRTDDYKYFELISSAKAWR